MVVGRGRAYAVIVLSFVVALILMVLPMPSWSQWLRPNWVLLVLIFWGMALPQRVGVGVAWSIGLVVDVLLGSLLGEHALAFVCLQFLVVKFRPQLKQFDVKEMLLVVLLLLYTHQFLFFLMQHFIAQHPVRLSYWLQPLIGALVWPWLDILLKFLRWQFKIHYHTEL